MRFIILVIDEKNYFLKTGLVSNAQEMRGRKHVLLVFCSFALNAIAKELLKIDHICCIVIA